MVPRFIDNIPAPKGTPENLVQWNGTAKNEGFLGRIPIPGGDGSYMTEVSVGYPGNLRPSLVPTLTPDEIIIVAGGGEFTPEMRRKIDAHAEKRIAAGLPVFSQKGDAPVRRLAPGFLDMMRSGSKRLEPKEAK
jgi:hypothetical protein